MLELIQDDEEAVEHACPMHDMMRAPDAAAAAALDDNATVRAMGRLRLPRRPASMPAHS